MRTWRFTRAGEGGWGVRPRGLKPRADTRSRLETDWGGPLGMYTTPDHLPTALDRDARAIRRLLPRPFGSVICYAPAQKAHAARSPRVRVMEGAQHRCVAIPGESARGMGSSSVIAVFETNLLIDALNGVGAADAEYARYERVLISRITWMVIKAAGGLERTARSIRWR